jgi:YidC/Oxa1 family membrane protein insertase
MTEFRNPNQEPGMDRRLLLIFALTFLILLAFQPLLTKYFTKSQPAPPAQPQPVATPPPPPPAIAPPRATRGAKQAAAVETETVIENGLYRITFSNKGALVKSWVLKKFQDEKGQPLELINQFAQAELQQNGQNVLRSAVEKYGYPMSLWTYDEGLREKLNSALYVASATGKLEAPADLKFEYAAGDLVVRKTFHFDDSYQVKVRTEVVNKGQFVQAYLAWPAGFGDQVTPTSYATGVIDYDYGDKVTRQESKKVSGGETLRGPFNWAGASDQYFGAVFLPDRPDSTVLVTLHWGAVIPKNPDKPDPKETAQVSLVGAAVGDASGPTSGRWFVGPKAVDVLDAIHSTPASGQSVGPNLGAMINFGFFGWVGKPLFIWLKWTQQHVISNWGWAIALQTLIINLALLPLRLTSMKSALKMQKVQPLVNDIKKKYEKLSMKDPRRAEMNREVSAAFKEHGVNPVGGCLPMVIQLPFLWAFYTMLSVAIELRHAHWLWIKDLSAPDPYHILPIAIIVSTWGMQRMTPSPGMDPSQARMMNIMMPVMLGIFSWAVAAGLGIYWLLGTLIFMVTQLGLNRTSLGQEMRTIAEKRAHRKASRAEKR